MFEGMVMDAESIRFEDLSGQVGRSDVRTTFWDQSEYHRDPIKQQQRERILQYMAGFLHFDGVVRLLSFPGESWLFERMFIEKRPTQCVGLEKSATIYHRSRRVIPGAANSYGNTYSRLIQKTMPYGRSTIEYSRVKRSNTRGRYNKENENIKTAIRSNRLLLMDAETYTSLLFEDHGAPKKHIRDWVVRFCQRDAVWLDYTCQICPTVERTLAKLPAALAPEARQKPIVITVMNGRDGLSGVEARISRLMSAQPALIYQKHWTYIGKGGVSMLNACFSAE